MAKLTPPVEVTQAEQRIVGFKHVSVFLAQAFEQQVAQKAKAAAAGHAPPGDGADHDQQQ